MIRTVLAMAAVAVGVSVAVAQSDPVSQRKALMKSNGQNAQPVGKMVRGEDPFDAAKVNAAFVQWTETAQKLRGRQQGQGEDAGRAQGRHAAGQQDLR